MKRSTAWVQILSIFLLLPLLAAAAPVGKITALDGSVDITSGGQAARGAKLGDGVGSGDILRAKSRSRAEVTFLDGNILRLAESTRVRITDYRSGEGKSTTLDLFRGKTQNIVSKLTKDSRYEIRTPNAIVGVRGTNFIAFFQNGVSGFLPREGTIYGYNREMPREVRVVTPGQAIMVFAVDRPAVVQPASSADVEKHLKDTTPGEKKGEGEKKDEGQDGQSATPPPPPPVPTNLPALISTKYETTLITTTVPPTVPPGFSGPLTGGRLTKMVTGSIKSSLYSGLYRIPAGSSSDGEFYRAGGTDFLRLRYESRYFDDGIDRNRGYGFELARYVPQVGPRIYTKEVTAWYLPNGYFLSPGGNWNAHGAGEWGKTAETFPNLNLAAVPTDGGGPLGTHPFFYGSLGNAANLPADYSPGTPGTGTFIKTLDFTLTDVNSQEQIGKITGDLTVLGSNPQRLWSSSSPADPVAIALRGSFSHDAGYEGSAFRGDVGFSAQFSRYVETAPGYGGAYFGQIVGHLPDRGATRPFAGGLYALYIFNPDAAHNRVGIISGRLEQGPGTATDPGTGYWQAEGTMNRLAELEIDNKSGVTAANLSANIVGGRAGVDATAGFIGPTPAPKLAMGGGYGYMPSIRGVDAFGLFFLGHNLLHYREGAAAQTAWETRGWGEFGRYQRTDDPSKDYPDRGYWYATLDNRAWADNGVTADFNGRFLTLMKYGTMTGGTAGGSGDGGVWSANSQGYWQKGGDLAFASEITGNALRPQRQRQESFLSGSSFYRYTIADPASDRAGWGAHSEHFDAATNRTTIQNFDVTGTEQQKMYVRETWTTGDGGATWSVAVTQYPDEAAYLAAVAGVSTPPPGSWTPDFAGDRYEVWYGHFGGIMGGLSANLWLDKRSPLLFQGQCDTPGGRMNVPALSFGEIASLNPLAAAGGFENSALRIGGAYAGTIGVAVDSASNLAGNLMALYQDAAGTGGVLYSTDIAGAAHPQVGAWEAAGTLNVYPLTSGPLVGDPKLFAQSLHRSEWKYTYASGEVRVDPISGSGTYDKRTEQFASLAIPGQPWSIWNSVAVGTSDGTVPAQWTERRESERSEKGGLRSSFANVRMAAPVNGVSSGTSASALVFFDEPDPAAVKESYTIVLGGAVKGLFDPATTPKTWMSIAQGGAMETSAFLKRNSALDDAAKAGFEQALKIPSFDVGMANLRGSDGNLVVNMDGIKFLRFRTEADPRIWATNSVAGSYTSDPSVGTRVRLTSSGALSGLTHTFEVRQWNRGNDNWGAFLFRGTGDTGGTLTRSAEDAARLGSGYLPAGAAATIPITELRGGAAGKLSPGSHSFSGTAAGTVR